jgi:hypothetical protein
MIVTYFKGILTPKEGHVDCPQENGAFVLKQCFETLCSKSAELDKMLPKQLKFRQFEIVVHGEYLQGFDFKDVSPEGSAKEDLHWVYDKPIFNVLQLGIPEAEKPLIKT